MQASDRAGTILWRLPQRGAARRVWTGVLALAPLAWIGGLALRHEVTAHTWPEAALNRAAALRKAASDARRRGIDTAGWNETLELRVDPILDTTIRSQPPALRGWLYRNMPPRGLVAGFHDPKGKTDLTFDLNPRGETTGFVIERAGPAGCPNDAAGALAAARQVFLQRFGKWPQFSDAAPATNEVVSDNGTRSTRFVWQVTLPEMPDMPLRLEVGVTCGEVTEDRLRPDVLNAQGPGPPRIKAEGSRVIGTLVVVYFIVAIVWIAVRYVKRTLQREVGQGRILLAGAIFALSIVMALLDRASGIHISGGALPLPLLVVFIAIGLGVVGVLFGMAYAAAEGEVRELYPGTMTSLDALLAGRLFTRNAGSSILLGMALGGWLLLATQGASLLRAGGPVDISELEFAFARIPWLTALLRAPASAIMTGVFAFLVPLALFHHFTRRWKRRWPKLPLVLVFAATTIGFSLGAPKTLAEVGQMLWGAASAAVLFAAFFLAADLLAGLAALAALKIGLAAGALLAASAGSLDLLILLGAGVLVAGLAWQAVRHGRVVSDEEVRPLYATHLAERLRLERELDATGVAQQRLLPVAFPRLEGLNAAGACLPAMDVAGDFYDVYPLSGGRLAVFLAEGGGQRLARALSMALVKGYLLQKVDDARAPSETLGALHAAIGGLVEGSTENLCLAVVDPRAMQLRYARTGASPTLLLRRTADSPALPCAEAAREVDGLRIFEGAANLEPGSLLLVYSDGLGRRGALVRRMKHSRFERQGAVLSAAEVVNAILARVSKRSRRQLKDDLTLVAVRIEALAAASREEVA